MIFYILEKNILGSKWCCKMLSIKQFWQLLGRFVFYILRIKMAFYTTTNISDRSNLLLSPKMLNVIHQTKSQSKETNQINHP